jgi:hypothetical protein
MKGITLTAKQAILALGAAALMAPAYAGNLDFEIVNRTSQPIVALWASPTSSGSWGQPFQRTFVASDGRQAVQFNGSSTTCIHDIRVQFSEGAVHAWKNVDLCKISGFQVFVSNGEVRASTW